MQRLRLEAAVLALTALLAAGCTKDEAEQTADWTSNVERGQRFAAKFPSFKSVLEKRTAEAQEQFDAAKGLADKKARAEAMGVANRSLTELLRAFDEHETASKRLTEALAAHATVPEALQPAVSAAREGEATATRNMGGFEPSNVGAAKVKLEDATALLRDATDALDATDKYLAAERSLDALVADKDLGALPAAQLNPLLEAASAARRTAGYQLMSAGGVTPSEAKAAVLQATKTLADAAAPLKALKPSPPAKSAPAKK